MKCSICKIRNICKIYETIKSTGTYLIINDCEHYIYHNQSDNQIFNNTISEDIKTTEAPVIKEPRVSRAMNDISELSNKMRAKEQAKKMGVEFIERKEEDYEMCSNCNDKVLMTFHCTECQKEICPSCATIDLSNPLISLCGDCSSDDIDDSFDPFTITD